MSLYPTKTRLALLALVAADGIGLWGDGECYLVSTQFKVTAAMARMLEAGWVELGPPHPLRRLWQVTAAGLAVLEQAGIDEGAVT